MRVGLVRKIGFTLVALGVVGLGGCNDDPLDFDEQTAIRMFTNPSFMVVRTGDSVQFVANGINAGNEPTFQAVTATVASCGGSGSISVVESDQQTPIQPPQIYEVIAGTALGGACVVVQTGSITDTVDVVVVGGSLEVVTPPAAIRAAETSTMVVELIGIDSVPVTPFAPEDVVWTVDVATIATVDASGVVTGVGPGTATITATWTGTDATGTSGQGVSVSTSAPVTVTPNVPVAAVLADTTFGAVAAAGTSTLEVIVTDLNGNVSLDPSEVLGATVASDAPGVATAVAMSGSIFVEVTGVSAGVANISGTVQTSTSGDLAFGPVPVFVLDPQIVSLTPDNGGATGETVTITGTGLAQAGFATTVTADGVPVNIVTVDSDVQLTIAMRGFSATGAHDIAVDVGGVESAAATWTANAAFDEDEPNNDALATAPTITFPFDFDAVADAGELVQAFGHYDLYKVTLAAPGTINITLVWDNAPADIDVYIWESSFGEPDGGFGTAFDGVPGGPDGWSCGFAGGSGGGGFQPEATGDCALPAGDYLIWIYDFGAGTSNYTVYGTLAP